MRLSSGLTLPLAAIVVAAGLGAACGGSDGPGPGPGPIPTIPSVVSVSPNSGTTLGGTAITVTGANFAFGVQVTVGGAAATNVVVTSSTTLTATTSTRSAGTVEVTVTLDGRSGSLPAAFTYIAPGQVTNQPPVIQSITARGVKPNEPENFADLGEEIVVTGTATDAETTPDRLAYEWTGTDGAFIGTGPSVTWRAPASGATPFVANLKLTVVDRFQTTDGSGLPITFEHRVEKTFTVKVHDSTKEVGGMATLFLENFSKSSVAPAVVMQDFLVGCYGTAAELQDVIDNRNEYTITGSNVGPATVTVSFGGTCAFRNRPGDACSNSSVSWTSIEKATGKTATAEGTDQVTAVYRDARWWLCDSQFNPKNGLTSSRFLQLLTR
ncbi:MAG: IPT/TIG domain-containing protein [Vicinamibacteria bacterium]|nr:IPT/TIG domain-containing protein [Vicinamibacteria bacterium]